MQSLAPQRPGGDNRVPVGAFAGTRDEDLLDRTDEPVGEHLGVDPKVFVIEAGYVAA